MVLLTMTESNQTPKSVKHDPRVDHPKDIQFSKVLNSRDPLLVVPINVYLHTPADIFQHLVDNGDREFGVVSLKIVGEHSEECDTTVGHFPRSREHLEEHAVDLLVVPMQLA